MTLDNYTATTLTGLEEVLEKELREIGARNIVKGYRSVRFKGDKALMYRANLEIRTALRILKPVHRFRARNDNTFYRKIREIDWRDYLSLGETLAVDSVVNSPHFTHSKYMALRVKDAIVDQFRKHTGKRPSVDVDNPSLQLNLYINNDECILSLDSSGDSLHRRGYRLRTGRAPLNEVLAAGMVLLSEWDRKIPFIDPMCGAGTILVEAALFARRIAPGLLADKFGFQHWPDYEPDLWKKLKQKARENITENTVQILGSDKNSGALKNARSNITRAKVDDFIKLGLSPFEERNPSTKQGMLVMNPPYGERLPQEDITGFYQTIGDTLKQRYAGHTAWILSANKEAIKHIGLRTSKRYTLYNGPLECKFHRYDIY